MSRASATVRHTVLGLIGGLLAGLAIAGPTADAVAVAPQTAHRAETLPAPRGALPARWRLLQAVPQQGSWSVTMDSAAFDPAAFATVSGYRTTPPGRHHVHALGPHGEQVDGDIRLAAGSWTTLVLGQDGPPPTNVGWRTVADTFVSVTQGHSAVRLMTATTDLAGLELVILATTHPPVVIPAPAAAAYTLTTAGSALVSVRSPGDPNDVLSLPVTMAPERLYSVIAVGGGEIPLRLVAVRDAVAAPALPAGMPINTGGVAPATPRSGGALVALLTLLAVLAVTGWLRLGGRRHRGRRRLPAVLPLVAAVALLANCAAGGAAPAPGGISVGTSPVRSPSAPMMGSPTRPPPDGRLTAPVHVDIPAAGVSAAVDAFAITQAQQLNMSLASDRVAWLRSGPDDGETLGDAGVVVLAGHVTWSGKPAVFGRLAALAPGDTVIIALTDGTKLRYQV
jgi:hypothetical protein